jgi:hypothetical protein
MKLTDLALLVLIMTAPMHAVLDWQYSVSFAGQNQQLLVQNVLRHALDDASFVMIEEDDEENVGLSAKDIPINRERASEQLLRSLQTIDRLYEAIEKTPITKRIAFIVAIEYDGYSIYADGQWREKRSYYATLAQGEKLLLTLDDRFWHHDPIANQWLESSPQSYYLTSGYSQFRTDKAFAEWRRMVMMEQIEQYVRDVSGLGDDFLLLLPKSEKAGRDDSELGNIIDQVGLIACYRTKWQPSASLTYPIVALASTKISRLADK